MKRFFKFAFSAFSSMGSPKKTHETHLKDVKITKSFEPIHSERAERIMDRLTQQSLRVIHEDAEVAGKKSLAWVLWAFKNAADAEYRDGISVHDVSALVYKAAKIELYPINVSRVVHNYTDYIQQVSQDKKTKRYLLTEQGMAEVAKLALVDKH
ncbi:MAG: hypothetical protein WCK49_05250 [Myxococcaceae bacterium]